MAEVTMPQLGETVTEGTITKWFKAVGDTVAEDEMLFEVSTDKVDSEVPSPVSGVAHRDPSPRGRDGRRRQVLAGRRRRRAAAGTADAAPAAAPGRCRTGASAEPAAAEPAPAPRRPSQRPSPCARPRRRRHDAGGARPHGRSRSCRRSCGASINEHGLDAATIAGTGVGGRITRADVERAHRSGRRRGSGARPRRPPRGAGRGPRPLRAPAPPGARRRARCGRRRARERGQLVAVQQHPPAHRRAHGACRRRRRPTCSPRSRSTTRASRRCGAPTGPTGRPTRASASPTCRSSPAPSVDALRDFPHINASVGDDELVVHDEVNLAIAVDLDFEGLLAPVVHDADEQAAAGHRPRDRRPRRPGPVEAAGRRRRSSAARSPSPTPASTGR